jgi:hypothetical protein
MPIRTDDHLLSATRQARRKALGTGTARLCTFFVWFVVVILPPLSEAGHPDDPPSEKFAFKFCMLERSGVLDADRLRLARAIVTERTEQIALFTRHGHLSSADLAAKRVLIDTVANGKLAALMTEAQREDWDAWSRQILDVSQRLPVAPRSAGTSRRPLAK